mgnify:CR=1 FL=1
MSVQDNVDISVQIWLPPPVENVNIFYSADYETNLTEPYSNDQQNIKKMD